MARNFQPTFTGRGVFLKQVWQQQGSSWDKTAGKCIVDIGHRKDYILPFFSEITREYYPHFKINDSLEKYG